MSVFFRRKHIKEPRVFHTSRSMRLLYNAEDWRPILWVVLYFFTSAWAWNHYHNHVWVLAVVYYLSFAGACISHNTMHARTFLNSWHESVWRHMLSHTYGHPVSTFVSGHNLSHHRYTQTAMDPMRTSKLRYKFHLLNFLLFQPTVAADVFRMDLRYLGLKRHCMHSYYTTCLNEWMLLVFSQATLLVMDPAKFALCIWLPHLFAQWAIVTMNLLQHDGCAHDQDDINGSRNFTGKLLNYLTFNNGFHTIHHMNPTLHWSKLPLAHAKSVQGKNDHALNQPSMGLYIFHTFVYPGRRVTFKGDPVKLGTKEAADQDWVMQHAPEGVVLEDFDISCSDVLRALPLMPFKVLSPLYSAHFKVN